MFLFHQGRFPFDQIFRFEIPGILCDEWNSIFRLVELTNPRSSGICLLALGLFDDSEVEIDDVLGKGDNITFIVRI